MGQIHILLPQQACPLLPMMPSTFTLLCLFCFFFWFFPCCHYLQQEMYLKWYRMPLWWNFCCVVLAIFPSFLVLYSLWRLSIVVNYSDLALNGPVTVKGRLQFLHYFTVWWLRCGSPKSENVVVLLMLFQTQPLLKYAHLCLAIERKSFTSKSLLQFCTQYNLVQCFLVKNVFSL